MEFKATALQSTRSPLAMLRTPSSSLRHLLQQKNPLRLKLSPSISQDFILRELALLARVSDTTPVENGSSRS